MPNMPTIAETIPGFESTSWQGYFVPAGTPREIVVRLQQETAKVLKLPEVVERLRAGGNEGVGSTPEEFDARFRADIGKFAKIIADAKIPEAGLNDDCDASCLALRILRCSAAAAAAAQSYPNRTIRVVVPFAAGGAVDVLARLMGAKLTEQTGQPVIVENRPGAGGTLGADAVAKAAPDGYTILQNTSGGAIAPALYKTLPYRSVQGSRARHPDHRLDAGVRDQPEIGHPLGAGSDRARTRAAGQAQLWIERRRQPAAPDHGNAQASRPASTSSRCRSAATCRSTRR